MMNKLKKKLHHMWCGGNFSNKTAPRSQLWPKHQLITTPISSLKTLVHKYILILLISNCTKHRRFRNVKEMSGILASKNATKSFSHDCNKHVWASYLILWWMRVQDNDDLCITAPVHCLDCMQCWSCVGASSARYLAPFRGACTPSVLMKYVVKLSPQQRC